MASTVEVYVAEEGAVSIRGLQGGAESQIVGGEGRIFGQE
jgi:hypothetical protein